MKKTTNNIDGVFVDLINYNDNKAKTGVYDLFSADTTGSKNLKSYLSKYKSTLDDVRSDIHKLALLEEIIMELRAKENMSQIKLSMVRDYVYARCDFFRMNNKVKDIRVIVDVTSNLKTTNLDELLKDEAFMTVAKEKLTAAMEEEIKRRVHVFTGLYR